MSYAKDKKPFERKWRWGPLEVRLLNLWPGMRGPTGVYADVTWRRVQAGFTAAINRRDPLWGLLTTSATLIVHREHLSLTLHALGVGLSFDVGDCGYVDES